jgi:spore germination protein KC
MKKIKICLLLFVAFLLTGCGNYRELNDLAITTGIAFDIKEDQYIVSYMIANSNKVETDSKGSETKSTIYEGRGNTISSAYIDLNSKNPKIPYISHLEVVIISEDLAKQGMLEALDFLMRNPESRKEFYIVLSKGVEAGALLKTLTPLESFPSQNIAEIIKSNNDDQSTIIMQKYSDVITDLLDQGVEPIINGIELEGDKNEGQIQDSLEKATPSATMKIDTIGVFKKDKLLGWTNHDETVGINIINNSTGFVLLETKCDDKYMTSTLKDIKTEPVITFENDIPKIKLKIKADGAILEMQCKRNLEETKVMKELEKDFSERLKQIINETLNTTQKEYKSDIFGFGNYIYKNNLKKWNVINEKWDEEIFPNITIDVAVDINLNNKGSLEQSLKEVVK